eukprot:scaffold256145_cov17-Tisochrysis_lutea.AAC.1
MDGCNFMSLYEMEEKRKRKRKRKKKCGEHDGAGAHLDVLIKNGWPELHVFVQGANGDQVLAFMLDPKVEDGQHCKSSRLSENKEAMGEKHASFTPGCPDTEHLFRHTVQTQIQTQAFQSQRKHASFTPGCSDTGSISFQKGRATVKI